MIQYAHTNIITGDWKRLADFYIRVFGCKPVLPERNLKGEWLSKSTGVEDAQLRGVHLALPGFEKDPPTLEIFQYMINLPSSEQVANRKGYGHIAFRVDNVREILAKVIENGGSQVGDVVEKEIEGAGFITFVYARDIDGNIIELQNWKKTE